MLGVVDLPSHVDARDEERSIIGARSPIGGKGREQGRRVGGDEEVEEDEEVTIELSHV
jgi:hypothetical protein